MPIYGAFGQSTVGTAASASSASTANIALSVSTAISLFQPFPEPNYQATVIGIGTIQVVPFVMPYAAQFSAADVYVSGTYSATNLASSRGDSMTVSLGVYTRNLSTLSLASSSSVSYAFTVTGSSSSVSFQGLKNLTIPLTLNMTPGNYWYAMESSTASAGNAIAGGFSNVVDSFSGAQSAYKGVFGQSTAASGQFVLGVGSFSVTSAALPASIGFSELLGSALGGTAAPIVNFRNYTA